MRTSPRDALVADSITEDQRGLAFGFHRAADRNGAVIGLMITFSFVWFTQANETGLCLGTFQTVVLASLTPGFLAVISLAICAEDVPGGEKKARPAITFRGRGKSFFVFMLIVGLFDLGISSDAFLVLRAHKRGLNILGILGMLNTFNLVCTLVSTPGGSLSERIGRRKVITG